MFNLNHNQVTVSESGEKLVNFRYLGNRGWRKAFHSCDEYEEVLESSQFIPLYVRISEKRFLKPMYLALIPSRRFSNMATYVGFHGVEPLNAYLKAEGIEISFSKLTHAETKLEPLTRAAIERLLPSDVFQVLETGKWSYTLFAVKKDGDIFQKTVHGFSNRSAALAALRRSVSLLKTLNSLQHGWRDAKPPKEPPKEPPETGLDSN